MFLSQLCPNVRSAAARRDLADPYEMHRTILRAFPARAAGGAGNVLFRVEQPRAGLPAVLVLSEYEPAWASLPTLYVTDARTSSFDGIVFRAGRRLAFRVRANPTKRLCKMSTRSDGSTVTDWCNAKGKGKRVGLMREVEQLAWLGRKGAEGGFRVLDARANAEGTVRGYKAGNELSFIAVLFDGILEVTDADLFRNALFAGIGPGKAFGFGLLSVAPVRG